MDQDGPASAGIWREVPRQPKQRRCHECGKRTFYWLLEKEGAVCDDCANLRTMAKPSPRSSPDAGGNNGKKGKSKIAPSKKIAILAKRAAGESKASISRDLHVAHNTVTKVLNETDFEQAVSEGRFGCVKLIPRAINGLGMAMDKGDGATCNRFLENIGVVGPNVIDAMRRPSARQQGAINVLVQAGATVTVQAAAAEKTINAEVVSSSDSPPSSQP